MEIITEGSKKGQHLSEKERYQIESLLKEKIKVSQIAKNLDRSCSTIYREIIRGQVRLQKSDLSYYEIYRADVAQARYIKNVTEREHELKIGKDREFEAYIRQKLAERCSPDAIIGRIKALGIYFEGMVCTKTLYSYIARGLFYGISEKDLWEQGKRKKRGKRLKSLVSMNNRSGRSIEKRPEIVNQRLAYGHWEGDCVKGSLGQKYSLFTLTERQTREEIIMRIKGTRQEEILRCLDSLEKRHGSKFRDKFKSITLDNGVEFLNWNKLERSIKNSSKKRTVIYYAHPYSSYERGSNENQNRMIRRFIPKGTDISKVSHAEIKVVEDWINDYPRKILGYQTAREAAAIAYTTQTALGNVFVAL